jgi:dipeptidyl aminopeptidase/acylaminoacyl peptidase
MGVIEAGPGATIDLPDHEESWERRFRAPAILFSQIAARSPDVGLVTSNATGLPQLYRWDLATGELTKITDEPTGRNLGQLSPDGRWVVFLRDAAGDEIGHWVAIPSGGGPEIDLTPGLARYASEDFAFSRSTGRVAFITASDDRLAVRVGTIGPDGPIGDTSRIHDTAAGLSAVALSSDGALVAVSSAHRSSGLEFSLLTFDAETGEPGPELWDGPQSSTVVFAFSPIPGDRRLAATTTASGRERAFVWDVASGDRQDLPIDAPAGDLIALDWSPDGREILLCRIEGAEQSLFVWTLESDAIRPLDHPSGGLLGGLRVFGSYFRPDGGEIVCRLENFDEPRRLVALDPRTGRQTRTILSSGEVPPGHAFRSVSFPTADGTPLQAWLAIPDGEAPYPVVLETHGGPSWAQVPNFHPIAQAFLDEGFAFLCLNYRGSTTFGREFEQSIWGRLGELESEDLVAARTWLIAEGIADPDRILLTGWSYGGYLTLLGLGRQPDLWAGGMAGVAVADWEMNYEDSSDLLRSYQRMLFRGGPEERRDAMRAGSPLTYVDDVRAPVLIIQGRNDTRTPARPVERYVERLRGRGHPVEIEWFEAGHLGASDELAIGHQRLMLEFARRVTRVEEVTG